MTTTDYNGIGRWSAEAIIDRYRASIPPDRTPARITPKMHREGERIWVYPVMDQIIELVRQDDPAAIRIAIEFISEDMGFRFGAILKSNAARRLRQHASALTRTDRARIRDRVVSMILTGIVPREYKEYARLLRAIDTDWSFVSQIRPKNRQARWAKRYYMNHCVPQR